MINENCESVVSEVFVFLSTNLKDKLKGPTGYWFVDNKKSTVQSH